MNLYEVHYKTWNSSFSNLLPRTELAVGTSSEDAIDRVKAINDSDCRDFSARMIETIMGHEIIVKE